MKRFEIKETSIKVLTQNFLNYVDSFSFIIRDDFKNSITINNLITILSSYLIEKKEVNEWPGTKLLIDIATLYRFHFNSETIFILYKENDNLFDWVGPDLPEDLVFYKEDIPVFISITHEKDAYIEISDNMRDFPKIF